MKKKIKKGAKMIANVRYRITIFTFFVLIVYIIGLWRFNFFSNQVTIMEGLSSVTKDRVTLEANIIKMVKGYPIEQMVPYILEKDNLTAAFLVSIAKKESNWGKRVPVLDGEDCFNYWGYRGIRERMGTGGHTCFDSPEDAVDTVGKRITTLIRKYDLTTPEDMIIWKCGSSCAGHSDYGVRKWILDVGYYFEKIINPS
ncbi:MAG: glucosaminidase domain-containing protein [Candidatus Moranbacteria bacterium]|nr:glucosaminidase domain-containing protein [Candidatus Moranbacteria bacterium]